MVYPRYNQCMPTINEIQPLAMTLSVSERATLASKLLESLPDILTDEDEGVAEALRRADELKAKPEIGLSLDDLDEQISKRFVI